MVDHIACSECSSKIRKERTLSTCFQGDIICGQCIKRLYGENYYSLFKGMIDDHDTNSKDEGDKGQDNEV